jgi:predicted MFS family arabinose efflux permease
MTRRIPTIVKFQLCGTFLNSASAIIKLFIPLYLLGAYDFSFTTIGLCMAGYGAGCVVGAYAGGIISERLDIQWFTALCLLASGVVAFIMSYPPPILVIYFAIPLGGVFDGAFRPANLRGVMESAPLNSQFKVQGIYRVVFNSGVAVAGILAGSVGDGNYKFIFFLQFIFCCSGGLLILFCATTRSKASKQITTKLPFDESPIRSEETRTSPWRDRAFIIFIIGQLCALGIFDQMYGTLGFFLLDHVAANPSWIGYLLSVNAVLIVLFQLPVNRWIERNGVINASRLGTVLLGTSFLFLNISDHLIWSVVTILFITAAELLLTPTWTMAVLNRSEGGERGKYLGIFSAAWLGHSLYGPAIGTWVYGSYGGFFLWWACACVALLVMLLHYSAIPLLWKRLDRVQTCPTEAGSTI